MKPTYWISGVLLIATSTLVFAQGRGGQAQSPASQRPPQTVTPQSFSPEQVRAGQARFISECGFCHGRDAGGGEAGPDLTRSPLVAEDVRGDQISSVVRNGRPEKGMPALNLSDADLEAIAAFIHTQKALVETLGGGRRSVDVSDLQTGNSQAGQKYFNGAGNCSKCHSATGDLAGIANRLQGLSLLQRMLYPSGGRPTPAPAGEVIPTVEDKLSSHFEQLGKYTDADMHNVFAYLQTLR